MHLATCLAVALALVRSGPAANDDEGTEKILQGIVRHDPKLEGGVWTLREGGLVYDLHGSLSGCKSGDTVQLAGRVYPDRVCHHMVGIVFKVTHVTVIHAGGKDGPRGAPRIEALRRDVLP